MRRCAIKKQDSEIEKNPVNITQSMKDILSKELDISIARYNYCGPNYTNQKFTWAKDFSESDKEVLARNYIDSICKVHDAKYTSAGHPQ